MSAPFRPIPGWAEHLLLPLLNLALALAAAALVVLAAGASPTAALVALLQGAFGDASALAYTLYYATDMIFAGLAVALAFHAGLFNIGAEGQASIAGLAAALAALHCTALPAFVALPLCVAAAALGGAAWAAIPGWLQAHRGSHIVITTIMFNFIASSLMVWLLSGPLIAHGDLTPETAAFPTAAWMSGTGGQTPLNASLILALFCAALVWAVLWHTPWGYALRVLGQNPRAALYGGIDTKRQIVLAMLASGALAGGIAVNEVLGAQHRLQIGFVSGYGFTGIAVALMGRNHPAGILPAALLFGALYQGGAEMAFDLPRIGSDLVVAIQGLVILTTGGAPFLLRPLLARAFARARPA